MSNNKKIRLLVAFVPVHIGGAMTSLVNFLNALDTDKYDVDVIFYENGTDRCGIKDEINILPQGKIHDKLQLKNILGKGLSPVYLISKCREIYCKRIEKNIKKGVQIMSKQGYKYSRRITDEYDIAVAYEFAWPLNYVMNTVKAKHKILWHHLEYGKSGFDFRIDEKALNQSDAMVFVSEDCKAEYDRLHPQHRDKTYFIPNILASDFVRAKGKAEVAELPFNIEEKRIKFVSAARIDFDHKGFDRAVRVLKRLKSENLLDGFVWLIIGDGDDLPELERMIENEGLGEHIYTIGKRTNPIPYMKGFDAMFLPSRYEGKPMVVTEGLIMGLAGVVTRYTSADEQIRSGYDGLVFDNSEEGLYQGLKGLFEKPGILTELKNNVKNTDYGNEFEIKRFDALVDKLIERR